MTSWWKRMFGGEESSPSEGNGRAESAPSESTSSSASAVAEADAPKSGTAVAELPWWERADQIAELADRPVVVANEQEAHVVGAVAAKLAEGKFPLPVMPFILLKAIELSNQAEPDIAELAQCVRSDAVIAGEVLTLVNSAAFAPKVPIKDLHRAVLHVGTRRARSLMIGVAARLTVFRNVDAQRGQQLWAHSLGCAVMARAIARAAASDPEEAFVAGLLHDIGKTVVLGLVADGERQLPPVRVPEPLVERLFEECHTGVGRRIAELWKLPPSLCDAIEHHHGAIHAKTPSLVAITALANDVCASLGIGVPKRKAQLGSHRSFAVLGIEDEKRNKLLELLPAVLEEAPEFKTVLGRLK